jgi:hypothetical protein
MKNVIDYLSSVSTGQIRCRSVPLKLPKVMFKRKSNATYITAMRLNSELCQNFKNNPIHLKHFLCHQHRFTFGGFDVL